MALIRLSVKREKEKKFYVGGFFCDAGGPFREGRRTKDDLVLDGGRVPAGGVLFPLSGHSPLKRPIREPRPPIGGTPFGGSYCLVCAVETRTRRCPTSGRLRGLFLGRLLVFGGPHRVRPLHSRLRGCPLDRRLVIAGRRGRRPLRRWWFSCRGDLWSPDLCGRLKISRAIGKLPVARDIKTVFYLMTNTFFGAPHWGHFQSWGRNSKGPSLSSYT